MKNKSPFTIKVLLIDDSRYSYLAVRKLFEEFKDQNYQLDWTASYNEAIKNENKKSYDVYLVDYLLDSRNGLDLMSEPSFNNDFAPVIFLTGSDDEDIDVKVMEAGAADYLVKGQFDSNTLERAIRYSLKHSQALNALGQSETKYRNLIESLPVMFYSCENRTPYKFLYISPSFEMFGYPLDKWLDNSDMWINVLHPEDRDWVLASTDEAVSLRSATNYEYRVINKNGEIVWIHDQASCVKHPDGKNTFRQGVMLDITMRKNAQEALKEHEERFSNLFDNANDVIFVRDLDGRFLSVNNASEKVFGYTSEEMLHLDWKDYIAPEHHKSVEQNIAKKIAGVSESIYELNCITKNGRKITIEVNSCGIYKDNQLVGIQGISRDITERKVAEKALKESEERFREIFDNANDIIYTHDLSGKFTTLNRAGEIITGYSRTEATNLNISDIIVSEDLNKAIKRMSNKFSDKDLKYEITIKSKDKRRINLEVNSKFIVKDGKPIGVHGIARDITERKLTEEKLQRHALYDSLTNLPNRSHFMNYLKSAMEQNVRDKNHHFAVLFLDLDRFKIINDALGHHIGDKLLISIASRIQSSLRPGDVVARLGGDEFTVLVHKVLDEKDAINVAERIQEKLSAPFLLDNYEVYTSASIGIVLNDENHRIPEDLLRNADAAMYRAKDAGKAKCEIFDEEMYVRNINLLKVETDLRRAIEQEEFRVYYQPIVSLESGKIEEFEALVRWEHPQHGLILPNEFIPISEETGLIVQIGKWVVEESCRQTKEWQHKFTTDSPISISVNLSAKQLMHPALLGQIQRVLTKTGLSPHSLKLEVTETMVMKYSDTALSVLSELDKLGVRLSTDDFGTGYSSLSYLHRYPFERIKIDRSFVSKMDSDIKSEAIIRSILMLGNNLEIEVVAEGIETEKQLWQLRSLGCKLGQGFLFSKPVTAEFAENLLKFGLSLDIESQEKPFSFSNIEQNKFAEFSELPS